MYKIFIIYYFILPNEGFGQAPMPIPPFPGCPSLPPNGVATTPHALAVADSLTSEALHLLNAETDSLVAKTVSWFPKPTVSVDDMVRPPHIWLISNHKSAATIGWSPIHGVAEYRLVVEPHGASAGLIQQFSLKGSVQKYRFPKLRQHGAYQIYLTALSDKGAEIKTVECTFNL